MSTFKHYSGQALLESLLVLSFIAVLLAVLSDTITPLHEQQLKRIEDSRAALWRWQLHSPVEVSDHYEFAERAGLVLKPLEGLTGLVLEQDNLRMITSKEDFAAMARVTETWSPLKAEELDSRPARLTPLSRLKDLGVEQVQDVISWLHFTEEFAADSLQFGHVANEATPAELPCHKGQLC